MTWQFWTGFGCGILFVVVVAILFEIFDGR